MRKTKKLPTYCFHKASGKGVVTLGGRDIYLPGAFNSHESRAAYDRVLAEYLAGGRVAPKNAGHGPTIVEIVNGYRRHCQEHYRSADGTLSQEVDNIRLALKPLVELYGDTTAADFKPIKVMALREKMIGLKWSRSYINSAVGRLRRCFKWGASVDLIPITTYQALTTIDGLRYGQSGTRETEPVKPVAQIDIDATLPYLNRHVRAMVEVQLFSGSRGGEICSMKIGQIDMSRPVWEYHPPKHKTAIHGHQRTIYLGPKAQAVLRPFLKADPNAFIFSPRLADEERRAELSAKRTTPLSCGNKPGSNRKRYAKRKPGECYTSNTYARAVKYGIDSANEARAKAMGVAVEKLPADCRVADWHPHRLRHSAATMLREVAGVDVARTALGHSSLDATATYAEASQKAARAAMLKVG
ncbi:MAG: site-specific integrase [Phycisphaerales bacterium]|nr:site-specific integrase [Phycisphaerales bacterium]